MWRRVGLAAVAVVVALFAAYIALVVWQRHIAGNNQRKAAAAAAASASRFARAALTAAKQGRTVTTASLRTLNTEPGLGLILARQSGSRVVVTFEVTVPYVIPGFTSGGEVERCFTETIEQHRGALAASTAALDCAKLPVPGP
jgi:hypothetical protein